MNQIVLGTEEHIAARGIEAAGNERALVLVLEDFVGFGNVDVHRQCGRGRSLAVVRSVVRSQAGAWERGAREPGNEVRDQVWSRLFSDYASSSLIGPLAGSAMGNLRPPMSNSALE